MLGSSVEPDLLETMNSVFGEIDRVFERHDLRRIGRVEHQQLGRARDAAERFAPAPRGTGSSRPCRAARTWVKPSLSISSRSAVSACDVSSCCVDDGEPAEPAGLVAAGPERRIARQQAARAALLVPFRRASRPPPSARRRQRERVRTCRHARALASRLRRSTASSSFVNGSTNFLTPSARSSSVTSSRAIAGRFERRRASRLAPATSSSGSARLAVVAERGERLGRHRVDRVGADQLLDVEDVAVVRVLRAGARPQHALRPARPALASASQRGPAKIAL